MKQVILVRSDLKMRRGKEIAQGAHASMKAVIENLEHEDVKAWLSKSFTKIALTVDSEEELLEICDKAKKAGLIMSIIEDAGRTEFHGVPTITAAAIGPGLSEKIDEITGHLRLR